MSADYSREIRKFVAPEFIFGSGCRLQVGQYAANFGAHRVLLVTDSGVVAAGWAGEVEMALQSSGIETVLFQAVTPNPKDHETMHGLEIYRQHDCDAIVAVGGGSPMDCAKGIAIVASNGGNILDYEGVDMIPHPCPPLICIPTTAGTAADVSQFAIISNTAKRYKFAIISKAIVPDLALVDPETTLTMDPFLSACTGMDALTHAIEACFSNAHSPITDLHAFKAIELIADNLEQVIVAPDALEYREQLMLASLEAGLAFSNASLGAVHAMAHSLGGFLDLPHGECNAILLRHVMSFNQPNTHAQFVRLQRLLKLDIAPDDRPAMERAVLDKIERLRNAVGITRRLGQLGVHRSDISELAIKAINDPCLLTNPRQANQRDLEVIYEEAL